MKLIFSLLLLGSVAILGYAAYVDAQNKKRQELIQIVNDAEHSLNSLQSNPNYMQHHNNLASYKRNP